MRKPNFAVRFALSVLVVAGAVVVLDVVVDPYLIFDRPRVAGFNATKIAVTSRERLMKAYDGPRHDARTWVIGSSRSDIGLRPASDAWPAAMRPVYNLSLAGSAPDLGLLYLRHQLELNPPTKSSSDGQRTIIAGLDFEYALSDIAPAGPRAPAPPRKLSETEQRLVRLADGSINPERRWRVIEDEFLSAFSLAALSDSIATLVANRRVSETDLKPDGHLTDEALRRTFAADGAAAMFAQKNRQFVDEYAMPRQELARRPDGSPIALEPIDALLTLASQANIAVVLFIQPAHADRLELIDRLGYWEDYEQWKIALADLAAQYRRRGSSVRVFDFGDYESFSLEAVPPAGDKRTELTWFWEPAHYKYRLGDQMIQRMAGSVPGSGVELKPDDITARLQEARERRAAYRRALPDAAARVDRALCTSKAARLFANACGAFSDR